MFFYVFEEVVWNMKKKLNRMDIVLNEVNWDFKYKFIWDLILIKLKSVIGKVK